MTNGRLAAVLAALALWSTSAQAATYYVRTDGNDSNTGSGNAAAEAWRTLQYAADNATPGDLVLVAAGTYAEDVVFRNAGQPTAPIVFRALGAASVGSAAFQGSGVFSQGVSYYTTLEGFTFDGTVTGAGNGISFPGVAYVTIQGCTFRNYAQGGLSFGNNAWLATQQITVRDSLFEANGYGAWDPGSGMLVNSTFERCRFVRNGVGYYVSNWGSRYVTFDGCTFEANQYGAVLEGVYWYWLKTGNVTFRRSVFAGNGDGLVLGSLEADTYQAAAYGNSVVNCTFSRNQRNGILVNVNFDGTNNATAGYWDSFGQQITNTILVGNGRFGIDNWQGRTVRASHDLAWANGAGPGNQVSLDAASGSILADPMLGEDLRPRPGSPAIDAGDPAYDADPVVTDGRVDIGAFEANAAPADVLRGLAEAASSVPGSFLRNENNSLPLSKKLYVVMELIMRGDAAADPIERQNYYFAALQKLERDVLPKTDGCALGRAPDANDWVTACSTQADFHQPILDLMAALRPLTGR